MGVSNGDGIEYGLFGVDAVEVLIGMETALDICVCTLPWLLPAYVELYCWINN